MTTTIYAARVELNWAKNFLPCFFCLQYWFGQLDHGWNYHH